MLNQIESNNLKLKKENSSYIWIIIIAILLFLIILFVYRDNESDINGKDENLCISSAGYSWNESIGACVRNWELKPFNKSIAAKMSIEHIGSSKGLTIVNIELGDCSGCFNVHLTREDSQSIEVKIKNWKIIK